MKKYIIVAIISLLCFSSCVISDGDERPRSDYGKRLLAGQVVYSLLPVEFYPQFAIYGEALLSGAQADAEFVKNRYFSGARVFEEGTTIVLLVGRDSYTQYEVRTDGKMLSEGGTWQLVEVIGSGKVEELCSIEGVAGELQCFKLHCQDPIYRYYYAPTPCDISVDIEYALDVERESVVLEITGGGIIGEKNKYTTTFNIDVENPLLYKSVADNNGYIGGKIAAVYKDFEYKKTKSIIITYDSSGKYSCE